MIYAVGTSRNLPCQGGLFMVDVSNPANPVSPGCVSQDGYVHDAQCVVYNGPDAQYVGREICFNYNEDTVSVLSLPYPSITLPLEILTPHLAHHRGRHQ